MKTKASTIYKDIETDRLILRRMKMQDAAELFDCYSNPNSSRYSTWPPHKNIAYTKQYIKFVMRGYRKGLTTVFCIVLKKENRVIGSCSFSNFIKANKTAEIGYTISSNYWNNGYGREAVLALMDYGFTILGLNSISAQVVTENGASIAILNRLGFKQKEFIENGVSSNEKNYDVYAFEIKKEEIKGMEKIKSFQVNHNTLKKGLYVSRVDREVVTYDLRMKLPNSGDYLDFDALHTIEHLFATYVRNSSYTDKIIYVGPMGCRTGFYFLVSGMSNGEVLTLLRETFKFIADFEGAIPGNSAEECGNYLAHNLPLAKKEAADYLVVLNNCSESTMNYAE